MAFILAQPAEAFTSLFKKVAMLHFIGVHRKIFGWRKRASYSFMRCEQYENGLFEHKVLGPVRSIEEHSQVGNVDLEEIDFDLSISGKTEEWADCLWQDYGLNQKVVIAIAPGAIRRHKQWPIENFITVARELRDEISNIFIIIIGTAQDHELGNEICKELGTSSCLNLAGDLHLTQSAALLGRCRMLVANDGGAVHLATAVGCCCVVIANEIEYPGSIEPWFSKEGAVRYHPPCAPCYSFLFCPTGEMLCVRGITPEQVLDKCRTFGLAER